MHLKNLVSFATGQSRFLTVGGLKVETLKSAWAESVKGIEFALDFLKNNVGIDSPVLLSSPFILITLADFCHNRGYNISQEEAERLRFWILVANAKGRYSRGSTETFLIKTLQPCGETIAGS